MPPFIDETGNVYDKLTVLGRQGGGRLGAVWLCACACGGQALVSGGRLRAGNTKSCGCARYGQQRAHGHTVANGGKPSSTYSAWQQMKGRCSPTHRQHADYAGRGIGVCARWAASFEAFIQDMGERPPGLWLDRIDNNAGYSPDNCRWSTPKEQRANQRCSSTPCAQERARLHAEIARLQLLVGR